MTRRSTPQSRRIGKFILIGLLLLLAVAFWFEQYLLAQDPPEPDEVAAEVAPTAAPTVLDRSGLEVFFTTPGLVYPDVASQRTPPEVEQRLIADIDAARVSVDLVTFEYNLTSIAEALVRAERRGVNVRLVLDRENLEKPEMAAWAGLVEEGRIPISWENSSAFMHSKFVIVDRRVAWTGSWNVTVNDTYRNNNNLLRISLPDLVENYSVEFEQMFAGRFEAARKRTITPHPQLQAEGISIENYFSPQDRPLRRLEAVLGSARRSIDVLAFSFTSDPIANAMLARMNAGVQVRGVLERRNVEGGGGEFAKLKRAGADMLEDGNCYTMHHKVIIIDRRIVITGSYNFTDRAETVNDENLLIIDDPQLARLYSAEFNRVYRQAQRPTRCER
ncbi:MAG: phospholipase D-like domain-containing protein [Chloroflexaceae bacterium]|jgi:phosphatidylserine/phosphatidylglycerophosphate/cardiolipin synthase-like enzyme|nr:phospholipase D-like domain-containing protein [Chloroflexaceae bacterium]